MARYRKKPIVIDAFQYTGANILDVLLWADLNVFEEVDPADRGDDPEITAQVWDKLHNTWVGVKDGQWIIRGIQDEHYPCDEDVFAATYDLVADDVLPDLLALGPDASPLPGVDDSCTTDRGPHVKRPRNLMRTSAEPSDITFLAGSSLGQSGMREWGRISSDGTVTITAADGTQTIASPDEAIAMYVRVAVLQGWPPLAELVAESVTKPLYEHLEWAWAIIANANGGNWDQAAEDWRAAAECWRDVYHGDLPRARVAD